jgi:hypothetical protein
MSQMFPPLPPPYSFKMIPLFSFSLCFSIALRYTLPTGQGIVAYGEEALIMNDNKEHLHLLLINTPLH